MAIWSDLYPHILPFVQGCDLDVVDFHTRQAAIEFCRRSQFWRMEIPITVQPTVETYLIPMPTDAIASMLLDFTMLDADGMSTDRFHLVAPNRGRTLERDYRTASYVYLSDDGLSLNVQPIPDVSDAQLVPYLSLKPTQSAATLPDFLVNQYADAIAAGALSRLLNMPKTAWRDVAGAVAAANKFNSDCGGASVRASRGSARSQMRSRGLFF